MDSPLSFQAFPFELNDIFHFAEHQDQIPWEPYKQGVDIFRLYGDGVTGPTAALVRYREHGEVPMHEHKGYEHILILTGSQRDGNGIFRAGTLVINPPAPGIKCTATLAASSWRSTKSRWSLWKVFSRQGLPPYFLPISENPL